MPILFRKARVLTLAGGVHPRRGPELRNLAAVDGCDVLVDGGIIAAVGPGLSAPPDAEVIDANGRVLLPGFVDCHTRACWAGSRLDEWGRLLAGVPRQEIEKSGGGVQATVAAVREATKKQLAAGLRDRLDLMLREGTTTVEVKSGYGLQPEPELKMLRAIQRTAAEWPGTLVMTALLGHVCEGAPEDFIRLVLKEVLPPVSHEFPGITVDACCDLDGWPVEGCVRLLERAKLRGHPVRVHADRLRSLGMISEAIRLGAVSVDQLEVSTKDDLLALAQSHVFGVILPCVGFHTNQRFARAGFFAGAGGALALATGCNPGTAPGHSMPVAISLAVRFCGLTPAEAITACTVNAAALLGLKDRGTIELGRRADLILLRHRDERMLAYELGGNPVDLVLCAGRRPAPGQPPGTSS